MKYSWKIVAAAGTVGLIALTSLIGASNIVPSISTASDIVPNIDGGVGPKESLPKSVFDDYSKVGINLGNSKLLGSGAEYTYYAVENRDDEICIIPVTELGKNTGMACTKIKNFEAYGLRIQPQDGGEQAWLISPNTGDIAKNRDIQSVTPEGGAWKRVSSNFLISSVS